MSINERLADAIKHARLQMGLSQEQMAEIADVSPTHIKHLESGHRKPSVDLLFTLAQTNHFSLDEILRPATSQTNQLRNEINCLLNDCTEKEQKILLDLLISMVKNR